MSIFADHGVKRLFGLIAELEKRVKVLEAQSHERCSAASAPLDGSHRDLEKLDKRTKEYREWRNSQTANSSPR